MAAIITENQVEQLLIDELAALGYAWLHGGDISPGGLAPERQYKEVVPKARLEQAVAIIKPGKSYTNT
jgi:hypothetical protein